MLILLSVLYSSKYFLSNLKWLNFNTFSALQQATIPWLDTALYIQRWRSLYLFLSNFPPVLLLHSFQFHRSWHTKQTSFLSRIFLSLYFLAALGGGPLPSSRILKNYIFINVFYVCACSSLDDMIERGYEETPIVIRKVPVLLLRQAPLLIWQPTIKAQRR